MISNVVWATPMPKKRRCTVNEKVDVFIKIVKMTDRNGTRTREFLAIRFFKDKFAQIFKDASYLRFGVFGNYIILDKGGVDNGFTAYKTTANPEIRIPVDTILGMNRDPSEMEGSYLIKYDYQANQAYIDLTRKATT